MSRKNIYIITGHNITLFCGTLKFHWFIRISISAICVILMQTIYWSQGTKYSVPILIQHVILATPTFANLSSFLAPSYWGTSVEAFYAGFWSWIKISKFTALADCVSYFHLILPMAGSINILKWSWWSSLCIDLWSDQFFNCPFNRANGGWR